MLRDNILCKKLRHASNPLDSFVLVQGQHFQAELPLFDTCLKSHLVTLFEIEHISLIPDMPVNEERPAMSWPPLLQASPNSL